MKAKRASETAKLEEIPNIGKSVAENLRGIGITRPDQLKGQDGLEIYYQLNRETGVRHDPCVADTFMAAVDFMNGGKPKPWWKFTAKRKKLLKDESSKKRILAPIDDDSVDSKKIPLSKLINFGPVTLSEFESMGIKTFGQLEAIGWENVCRKWVEYYPERLNVNAFIGIIATLEGISWTKITLSDKAKARNLVNELRQEYGMPPTKTPKKKNSRNKTRTTYP